MILHKIQIKSKIRKIKKIEIIVIHNKLHLMAKLFITHLKSIILLLRLQGGGVKILKTNGVLLFIYVNNKQL